MNDLVKRLRQWDCGGKSTWGLLDNAADHIEKLEAALRKIAAHYRYNEEMARIARKALEGKDD